MDGVDEMLPHVNASWFVYGIYGSSKLSMNFYKGVCNVLNMWGCWILTNIGALNIESILWEFICCV
jgi:hypothetical protein